ncbi:hypothetical protein BD410DRAFT_800976 [Rickenella mellea]|uniref:Uncharacterized protein n=1 Tax=Rickenella mellea TaxID=50990 RepID=A0A4Y7QDA2_9AGAM|nr:hypothetical protein BD410DRAFT_800976 [Rickenella mellea]
MLVTCLHHVALHKRELQDLRSRGFVWVPMNESKTFNMTKVLNFIGRYHQQLEGHQREAWFTRRSRWHSSGLSKFFHPISFAYRKRRTCQGASNAVGVLLNIQHARPAHAALKLTIPVPD